MVYYDRDTETIETWKKNKDNPLNIFLDIDLYFIRESDSKYKERDEVKCGI